VETKICWVCHNTKPLRRFKYQHRNIYSKTCAACLRLSKKFPVGVLHPRHAVNYFELGIIELYNKGFSSIEILQKLNLPVSVRSIQRFLKKQGVPIRTRSDAFMLAIKKGRMDYENLRKDKRAGESRKGIGDKLRYQIMERDNFRCVFCGQGAKDGVALQIDHIIRPENGGDNSEKNLRLLCMSCNKGRYLYEKKKNL